MSFRGIATRALIPALPWTDVRIVDRVRQSEHRP